MQTTDILINQIITQALASRTAPSVPGHMVLLIMKVISITAAVMGLSLLMIALYHWLEVNYSIQQTLLYMSLSFLCISLFSFTVSVIVCSVRKKFIRQAGRDFFKTTGEFYEGVIAEIGDPLKDHRGAVLATAVLVGMLVGKKL